MPSSVGLNELELSHTAQNQVQGAMHKPLTLSPSTSGKSFVTAITVAKAVMKRAMKAALGLHAKGAPIASFTA